MKKIFVLFLSAYLLFCFTAVNAEAILDAKTIFMDDTPVQQPGYNSSSATQDTSVPDNTSDSQKINESAVTYYSGSTAAYTPAPQNTLSQDGSTVKIQLQIIADSDTISAVGYSETALILAVQMRATGEIRCYKMVSRITYVKFMESTVKDSFFANQIDGRYDRIM